mmetsp:Transcript_18675/g.37971  ORF Transcript_18675/g.37971 Transcript_18675/m.37971 type:complete len:288 (-) Transcript_18675:110-973(-)
MASFADVLATPSAPSQPAPWSACFTHAPSYVSHFPAYNPPAWNAAFVKPSRANNKRRKGQNSTANKSAKGTNSAHPAARTDAVDVLLADLVSGDRKQNMDECEGFHFKVEQPKKLDIVHPYLNPVAALNQGKSKPACPFGMTLPKKDATVFAEDIIEESSPCDQSDPFQEWLSAVQDEPRPVLECGMFDDELECINSPQTPPSDELLEPPAPQPAWNASIVAQKEESAMESPPSPADRHLVSGKSLAEENRALMAQLSRVMADYHQETQLREQLEEEVAALKRQMGR